MHYAYRAIEANRLIDISFSNELPVEESLRLQYLIVELLLSQVSIIGKFIARPKQFRFSRKYFTYCSTENCVAKWHKESNFIANVTTSFIKCQRFIPARSMYSISPVSKGKKRNVLTYWYLHFISVHTREVNTLLPEDWVVYLLGAKKAIRYVSVLSLYLYSRNKVASCR